VRWWTSGCAPPVRNNPQIHAFLEKRGAEEMAKLVRASARRVGPSADPLQGSRHGAPRQAFSEMGQEESRQFLLLQQGAGFGQVPLENSRSFARDKCQSALPSLARAHHHLTALKVDIIQIQ
jgi:hypothetical protein